MSDVEKIAYHIVGQTVSSVIEHENGTVELIMSDGTTLSVCATRDAELNFQINDRDIWDIKIPTNEKM